MDSSFCYEVLYMIFIFSGKCQSIIFQNHFYDFCEMEKYMQICFNNKKRLDDLNLVKRLDML